MSLATQGSTSPLTPPAEAGKRKIERVDGMLRQHPEKSSHANDNQSAVHGSASSRHLWAEEEGRDGAEEEEEEEGGEAGGGKKAGGRRPLNPEASTKRRAQNRAAQRAFRERREKYVKGLEEKINSLEMAITLSSSAQRTQALSEENDSLRQLIDQLSRENSTLKQTDNLAESSSLKHPGEFTFEVPSTSKETAIQAHGHYTPPGSHGDGTHSPEDQPGSRSVSGPVLGSSSSHIPSAASLGENHPLFAGLDLSYLSQQHVDPANPSTGTSAPGANSVMPFTGSMDAFASLNSPLDWDSLLQSSIGDFSHAGTSGTISAAATAPVTTAVPQSAPTDPLFTQYRGNTTDALLSDSLVDMGQLSALLGADPNFAALDDQGLSIPPLFGELGADLAMGPNPFMLPSTEGLSLPRTTQAPAPTPTPAHPQGIVSPISQGFPTPHAPLSDHISAPEMGAKELEMFMGLNDSSLPISQVPQTKDGVAHPLLSVVPQLGVLKSKDLDELCFEMKKKCKAAESRYNAVEDISKMSEEDKRLLDDQIADCLNAAQRTLPPRK